MICFCVFLEFLQEGPHLVIATFMIVDEELTDAEFVRVHHGEQQFSSDRGSEIVLFFNF